VFSPANVISVTAGVMVFVLGLIAWNTNRGVFVAALTGAIVTGVVWLLWWNVAGPPDMNRLLGTPRLGFIPDYTSSPAPTLTDTSSTSSRAYRELLSEVEGRTKGHVLLVSSPAPGQGASTVAMNLAVAGTQRGRRIALVDGDIDGDGVSRFLSTGSEPGLTDLADGTATLADASRLWTIGQNSVLPVVPSGSSTMPSEAALAGPGLAGSIGLIAERADAVLIDAPPIAWDGATAPLAAHADGTCR
jgi:Mrp family chromosome partitioning ATPase